MWLVYSTPGTNALSPYLNFDPQLLNPVGRVDLNKWELE
jgi:hypothetical protein